MWMETEYGKQKVQRVCASKQKQYTVCALYTRQFEARGLRYAKVKLVILNEFRLGFVTREIFYMGYGLSTYVT